MNLIQYSILFSETSKKLREAEKNTERNPSLAKIKAENYHKGKFNIDGLKISIENPRGSVRKGVDSSGKPWKVKMKETYGYINGIKSSDGDDIDVFLSKDPSKGNVYVVDQINPKTGKFDEHKCMYGYKDKEEATKAYLSNYNKGWKGLGPVTEVSKLEFKNWLKSKKVHKEPFNKVKSKYT